MTDSAITSCETPWGEWRLIYDDPDNNVAVKILVINPGQMLSMQRHEWREENWTVLSGQGIALLLYNGPGEQQDSSTYHLKKGHSLSVGRNFWHQLINPTDAPLVIHEVINGEYSEGDIEREWDIYGRA